MRPSLIIYVLMLLLLSGMKAEAQQVPVYSQYVLNGFLFNPAMAGAAGYSTASITAREQWIGINDAPSTYALSFHTKVMPNSFIRRRKPVRRKVNFGFSSGKVGLGGYVFTDHTGALGRTGLRFTYAYHLYNKSTGSQLSFGMSLVGYQMKFNEDKVRLRDLDDETWIGARESIFIPDADVGIYYSAPNYFAGLSVDQLLESLIQFGGNGYSGYQQNRNYYLFGGYDFELSRLLILTPSALLKVSQNGAIQGDLKAKLVVNQSYWGGLAYRTGHAIILSGGISIDRYVFGYAFDFSLANIMRRSYGSHEFMFAVKWGEYNSRRYRWINR